MGDESLHEFRDSRRHALGLAAARCPEAIEQKRNLKRVTSETGGAIVAFWCSHIGREYRADDLRAFVASQCGPRAPASADRIMRALKRKRAINYHCINRAASLYLALPLTSKGGI